MPKTRAWSPWLPVWKWASFRDGVIKIEGTGLQELFEEGAAMAEYHGGAGRKTAEIRAYADLINRMHLANLFSTEEIADADVIRQVERAASFEREAYWAANQRKKFAHES